MKTVETFPLNETQTARKMDAEALWLESLCAMANDDSDAEMQANARALLSRTATV